MTIPFKKCVHIGPHTLYLGDCYEMLPCFEPVDAIVTDPPYLFKSTGGGMFRAGRDHLRKIRAEKLDKGFDHTILSPALADSIVCFCHNDQLSTLLPWFSKKFPRHAVLAWHKKNPIPMANRHYKPDTEFYVHAWKKNAYPRGALEDKARFTFAYRSKNTYGHPTVKPYELMLKILRNVHSQVILDPFMGTGSTGVAAVELGRTFIGIELKEKHFNTACARVEAAYRDRRDTVRSDLREHAKKQTMSKWEKGARKYGLCE